MEEKENIQLENPAENIIVSENEGFDKQEEVIDSKISEEIIHVENEKDLEKADEHYRLHSSSTALDIHYLQSLCNLHKEEAWQGQWSKIQCYLCSHRWSHHEDRKGMERQQGQQDSYRKGTGNSCCPWWFQNQSYYRLGWRNQNVHL